MEFGLLGSAVILVIQVAVHECIIVGRTESDKLDGTHV